MRIPSGTTDQYIYFVAVDSTDLKTFETGLTTFTVYRARNGAAAAAYTTPTVAEVSSANMPGVYSLLLDEDMTIAAGNTEEEVVLRITQASMAPVTLKFTLFRPIITEGETLTVASGNGNAAVQSIANNAITAAAIATGAIDADAIADNAIDAGAIASGAITSAKFAAGAIDAAAIAADAIGASELAADAATEIATAVWAATTRLLTAGTNIVLAKGTGVTGFNDLDAAGIRGAVGLASANLDTQIGLLATAANLATLTGYVDTEVAAIKAKTDNLPSDPADASDIAAAFGTVNSTLATIAGYVDTEIGALTTAVADLPTNAELATALGTADDAVLAQIALVKAKTDSLTFTVANKVDANVKSVNDVTVTGTGASGDEWGP